MLKQVVDTMFSNEQIIENSLNNIDFQNIDDGEVDAVAKSLAEKFINVHKNFKPTNIAVNVNQNINNKRKLLSTIGSTYTGDHQSTNLNSVPDKGVGRANPFISVEDHSAYCNRLQVVLNGACVFCSKCMADLRL
jgi:hypothetical protein